MPEKHLFVNSSHYQDRPDPNMRHRIASHAARYGPNGSLAFKSGSERVPETVEWTSTKLISKNVLTPSPTETGTPTARSASTAVDPMSDEAPFHRAYEALSASLSSFCICPNTSIGTSAKSDGKATHTEECASLDDYLILAREHELPFRVAADTPQLIAEMSSNATGEGLVAQCLLVVGQTTIDGMDPKFKNRPSKRVLALQQKALSAMQRAISLNNHTIDNSIVLAAGIMLATAAYYADMDEYKAHHSSLQKLIELQGGFSQTPTHTIVKALVASAESYVGNYHYSNISTHTSTTEKKSTPMQFAPVPPFKLKYPMPPFGPNILGMIDKMSSGLQSLAKASKFSLHALQLLELVCTWSSLINHPTDSEAEHSLLPSKSVGARTRLLDLYDSSTQTKRIATLLLVSLPLEAPHMKLERCLCLGLINLLHSVTLRPHPTPLRDRLVVDFADTIISLHAKGQDEEDTIIWLAIAVANEWRYCASKLKASSLPALHGYDGDSLCQIWLQKSHQVVDWLVIKYERARSWETVVAICSRFLWLRRLGEEWRQTWEGAMERRTRNMPRKKSRS